MVGVTRFELATSSSRTMGTLPTRILRQNLGFGQCRLRARLQLTRGVWVSASCVFGLSPAAEHLGRGTVFFCYAPRPGLLLKFLNKTDTSLPRKNEL